MINSKFCYKRNRDDLAFPKLMISEGAVRNPYYLVVLFFEEGRGIVVSRTKATARYEVGTYWTDFDMADFKDFEGTVELSNFP